MKDKNLFDRLAEFTSLTKKVYITCVVKSGGNEFDVVDDFELLDGAEVIELNIRSLSYSELQVIDGVQYKVRPKQLFEEVPGERMGVVNKMVGYDYDDPDYLKKLGDLRPLRNGLICLFGCPELLESTEGSNAEEKALALCEKLSAGVVKTISDKIMQIGVACDDSADFFLDKESKETSPS